MSSRLDICIVSYARPDLLARCLAAVQVHLPEEQVRVWDNRSGASPDVRRLAEDYPQVDWTFSADARGYAAGANALLERCDYDRDIVLLNPDAILTGPLLRTRAALSDPTVAAVSPTVLDPTQRQERWDVAHRRQTVLRALVNRAGYADRLRGTPLSNLYAETPAEVDGYITGACLMMSHAAWRDVGPFDERYFLYGEDADWQRRARERGWRLVMVDEPEVRHGGESVASGKTRASQRAKDYLAANTALLLGGRGSRGRWTAVTAGDLLLERVQRTRRRLRRAVTAQLVAQYGRHAVVITTNNLERGETERARILLANELAHRGHPVTVVCLQALGPLQRELDDGVRLVLRPWWQPVIDLVGDKAVLVSGTTNTEIAFAAAWSRLGIGPVGRHWTVVANDPAEFDRMRPWWVRAVLRRIDRILPAADGMPFGVVVDEYQRAMAEVLASER